jgi:hypothetical protein
MLSLPVNYPLPITLTRLQPPAPKSAEFRKKSANGFRKHDLNLLRRADPNKTVRLKSPIAGSRILITIRHHRKLRPVLDHSV